MAGARRSQSRDREISAGVRRLQPEDRPRLGPFSQEYPFKPYRYYDSITEECVAKHFHESLCAALGRGSGFGCEIDGRFEGVLIFSELPWDSDIFGLPMAKVDLYVSGEDHRESLSVAAALLEAAEELCVEGAIRHLSCKVDTLDLPAIHALERCSFRLMDTVTTFSIDPNQIANVPPSRADVEMREMRAEDLPQLSDLSRTAFTNRRDISTRFTSDPRLVERAGDLYAQWLENSYRGERADAVIVADVTGRPIGFITCKLPDEPSKRGLGARIGSIPLNAVDREYRGMGVYRQLVSEALGWFRQRGVDYVEIRTQVQTLGVHRTWQQLNGRLVNSDHAFHRWRDQ